MKKEIIVKEWIENFNKGRYDTTDITMQCEAGWYDWFCKETSLRNKTYKMGNIIKKITNERILNEMYVFFKNNCPITAPLYDQFKFCDFETGDVIYCIAIDDKRENSKYAVYGICNDFEKCIFETDYSKELVNWLNAH